MDIIKRYCLGMTLLIITGALTGEELPWWAQENNLPQHHPANNRPWWEENPRRKYPPPQINYPPRPNEYVAPPHHHKEYAPPAENQFDSFPMNNKMPLTPWDQTSGRNQSDLMRGMFLFQANPELIERWMDRMDYWGNRMEQWTNRGNFNGTWNQLAPQNYWQNLSDPFLEFGMTPPY